MEGKILELFGKNETMTVEDLHQGLGVKHDEETKELLFCLHALREAGKVILLEEGNVETDPEEGEEAEILDDPWLDKYQLAAAL